MSFDCKIVKPGFENKLSMDTYVESTKISGMDNIVDKQRFLSTSHYEKEVPSIMHELTLI